MFSCNVVVVSRCAQLVSFLNCLQDVKLSQIVIYRDKFRRMKCNFISCGELHCDSVKIKTVINSSLFFLRKCESLDWSDCLVVLLLLATHFLKSGHARLIRGCFSFSQCFRAGVFSSLSPPPSSETQGQIVGTRESQTGEKIYMERRKVKNCEKSPWGQRLTRPFPNGRRHSGF